MFLCTVKIGMCITQNPSTYFIGICRWESTTWGPSNPASCSVQVQLEQVTQDHLLSSWTISKDADATVFLGNLAQGLTTLKGVFFSLYWIWIVQFVSIASCHVPVHLCKEPFSIFPTPLLIGSGSSSKLSPWAAVPQAVQTQLSQLVVHLVYHTAASQLSCFAVSVPVLSWEDQSWTIAPDAVSQMPGRGKLPSPSICRQCFS